ncbi:caspase family protein [Streptomyces sp. NPDC012769]|uniref:wHTH domain-containing protein n=1 Tax=Streptomyces sp. NPDC012769 TaxID=3364848 RepID=UPI0036B2A098
MGALRALLIAVPEEDLGFTAGDVERIRDALLGSGYAESDVTVLDTPEATTRDRIYAAINDLLQKSEDEDFALVYFSGHGVRRRGGDHLVPSGADRASGGQQLVHTRPDYLLEQLRSRATVMVCLDACRDEADEGLGTTWRTPLEPATADMPLDHVVLVHACAVGQEAMGTEAGSFMGRALAEALSPDSSVSTVAEVIHHVRVRAREIAEAHGHDHRPEFRWLGPAPGDSPRAGHRICAFDPALDRWKADVRASGLWRRVTADGLDKGALQDLLDRLIDEVLKIRADAGQPKKAGRDPWEDRAFPSRVLAQLDRLVPATDQGGRLSPLETVTLLAAPFVREAAIACGRRALAELYDPYGVPEGTVDLTSGTFRGNLAEDMTDVRRAYQQIDEKRERLRTRPDPDDPADPGAARATEQWLRHQLLADWDQLWDASTGTQETVGALQSLSTVMRLLTDAAVLAAYQGRKAPRHASEQLGTALQQVVMQMRSRPGPVAPDGKDWDDQLSTRLGLFACKWRPRQLAGLLHIAELLAIDPRLLDGIVIDHLGVTHLRVEPEAVVRQVANSDFMEAGNPTDLTLYSACENAALHVALERQVDSVVAAVRSLTKATPNEDLYAALPQHVSTDSLAPARLSAYDAPPPRFQLSEDGVKPLIMGTQLYGDRTLAVRELYQNALDACRRRQARQDYAAAVHEIDPSHIKPLADYTIIFTLGRDTADGRLYIECQDAGIGMTVEELRDLFARAGRRYEQSPARIREMRRWRRRGIVPEQNSRFGIGVFSYFMLAEAIQVSTRPASANGVAAAGESGHRVDVVADSGLMHITRTDDIGLGTRVRLYLRPEFCADPPSLVKVLRDEVWYSDVNIAVVDGLSGEGEEAHWPAGQLRVPGAVPLPRRQEDGNVWWVPAQGARLVDGVRVRHDDHPYGYVINLRRRHGAKLTADRNRLQYFDRGAAAEDLRAAVDDLLLWDPMPLDWLWKLAESDTHATELVVRRLLDTEASMDVNQWFQKPVYSAQRLQPLSALGCLPMDADTYVDVSIYEVDELHQGSQLFLQWRNSLVGTETPYKNAFSPGIGRPQGYPTPAPLDALVFLSAEGYSRWCPGTAALRASASSGLSLRATLRGLRRYAVAGVHIPEAADIRALDHMTGDGLATMLYSAYIHDGQPKYATDDPTQAPVQADLIDVGVATGMPLGQLAERLGRLGDFDALLPEPPVLGELGSHIPTPHEHRIVTGKSVPGLDSLPRLITPTVAAYAAKRTRSVTTEVAAVGKTYAALGYELSGTFDDAFLSDDDVRHLHLPLSGLHNPFGLLDLVRLSAERADPDVGTTAAIMRDTLRRLGLPEVSPGPLASVKAPSWWQFLGAGLQPPHGPLSVWSVLRALQHRLDSGSADSEASALTALAEAGGVVVNAPSAVRARLEGEVPPLRLLVQPDRNVEGREGQSWGFQAPFPDTSDRVDGRFLITFAAARRSSVGELADQLRAEAEPYGISVDDVPAEARDLKPELADFMALFTDSSCQWRTELTHRQIVRYAIDLDYSLDTAATRLRAYESLGAPHVPYREDIGAEPADRDPVLERLLFYAPLSEGTVTPLALVTTAVRLEKGLRSTYRALAPYTRYGLTLACPEPEDDSYEPDWQDVILLSRHLTGREPAVAGEVSEDHVQLSSEETELTPAQVRERLTFYAPLFGLHMPPPPHPARTDLEAPA